MGPKTQELINVLDQLATVLESDSNAHWGTWIRRAKSMLINSDYSGIEYLLSAYGGMGSLNDLVLGQSYVNGQFSWKPGHVELNEKFSALRTRAWSLAEEIKRAQA